MKETLKNEIEKFFDFNSIEDEVDFKADLLPLQFLGLVDQRMEELGMSKKVLAEKIGTSASFITQLFRGDRKPNWKILAKMSKALELEFKVMTDDMIQEKVKEEIMDYHRKWAYTQQYLSLKNKGTNPHVVMSIEPSPEDDYALAG